MTAHLISILSELKMTFDPYAGAKTRSPSIALSTALCWSPCQMPFLNVVNSWLVHAAGHGSQLVSKVICAFKFW